MVDITSKPIWDEAVELPKFPPLARDLTVDVAVVGAGLTGITTAWLLSEAGVRVALLDRRQVGGVDTGRTTAHLTAVVDTALPALVKTLGADHAQAVWDAGLAAIDQIDSIIQASEIDCDFAWVPGFRHVPFGADERQSAADRETLREESTVARDLGFDIEMVAATPLVAQPGWRLENQALFHPRKYLKGILAQLASRGVIVCGETDVSFTDDPEVLSCGGLKVRAPHVVLATHTPMTGRQSAAAAAFLQSKLALFTSYALAAHVKGAAATTSALYWDTAKPYHYIRVEPAGDGLRFVVGGEDHKTGQDPDTRRPLAALEQWVGGLLPTAAITHHWSGQVVETPDGLPFIGEADHRQYIATGFAGNGMTFGTLAAMMIRDAITGRKNPWRELFDVHRSAIARGPLDYLRENADYPYYLVRDRFAGAQTRQLRSVPRGEGRLVEVNGEVVAASRDANGRLTVLSATCTHLGCRVGWNKAEGTWDCPCHGSRFTESGAVLAGPAERPLAPAGTGVPAERARG